jgi:hypothetical protein
MPIVPAVIALGLRLFGDRLLAVTCFKTLLLLLPLFVSIWVVCRYTPLAPGRIILTGTLLLIPFLILTFLADVVGLEYEEFYSYGFLALGAALVFWNQRLAENKRNHLALGALVGTCAAAVYLSKSSMILAAVVLLIAGLQHVTNYRARVIAVVLALSAPMGWLLYQHHSGGRATLGTSIDGFNLHMGNSPHFLRDYPPQPGGSLDSTAEQLHAGKVFPDEWSMNDFHQRTAVHFIETHPTATFEGVRRKLGAAFLSVRTVGGWIHQGAMGRAETAGIVIFRILFWLACLFSLFTTATNTAGLRRSGVLFVLLVGAISLPYIIGFAYTRHISVLIYPTALYCSFIVQRWAPLRTV